MDACAWGGACVQSHANSFFLTFFKFFILLPFLVFLGFRGSSVPLPPVPHPLAAGDLVLGCFFWVKYDPQKNSQRFLFYLTFYPSKKHHKAQGTREKFVTEKRNF